MLFEDLYNCTSNKIQKLKNGYKQRIEKIIKCSKQLDDGYHQQLESLLASQPENPSIRVHKACASRYTSVTNVKAHIAHVQKSSECLEQNENQDMQSQLRPGPRGNDSEVFDFRKHCVFCPDICICLLPDEYDQRIPHERHIKAFKYAHLKKQMAKNTSNSFLMYVRKGMTILVTLCEKGYLVQLVICMLQMLDVINPVEQSFCQSITLSTVKRKTRANQVIKIHHFKLFVATF